MLGQDISFIILVLSLLVAFSGVFVRAIRLLAHPMVKDPSPPKASALKGVIYSLTQGMLPWKKESARLHKLTYLRGALFHLGIFASILLLLLTLFIDVKSSSVILVFSPFLVLGALAGFVAFVARLIDPNLRAISRLDDYISLVLVTLMMLSASALILGIWNRTVFWGAFSILCFYIPWSKIPHVIYFFFAKNIFGSSFGRRGVLPIPKTEGLGRGAK
jgi:nitrate reductase gamma subunit